MNTGTELDHKRIQGILVAAIGFAISYFTDWVITVDQLNFAVGEAMYVGGLLYSYFGGLVAQGPINWAIFGSNKVKINPDAVTVVDTSKLSDVEKNAFNSLMEKAK